MNKLFFFSPVIQIFSKRLHQQLKVICIKRSFQIESVNITPMEMVSARVLMEMQRAIWDMKLS